jgi:CheY-like chemotaxis protein
MRVLVCDDNVDGALTLGAVLRAAQHEVVICHDGRGCLEKARDWMPDVAILDIGMPHLNGYEVAAQLRALPGGDKLLLIALTGWGTATDVALASSSGFNIHLTKPADLVRLLELLSGGARCS